MFDASVCHSSESLSISAGFTNCHCFSPFLTPSIVLSGYFRVISVMSFSWTWKAFFLASSCFWRSSLPRYSAKYTYAPRITKTMNRMLVPLKRISLLPSIHPDGNSGDQNRERQQHDRYIRHHAALSFSQRQAPVCRILGTDGDKAFVLRKPGNAIHEKVAVALCAGKSIRCKIRVTVNNQSRFLVLSEVLCRNNSKRHGPLQIFLFVEAGFRRFHVGFAPASIIR